MLFILSGRRKSEFMINNKVTVSEENLINIAAKSGNKRLNSKEISNKEIPFKPETILNQEDKLITIAVHSANARRKH